MHLSAIRFGAEEHGNKGCIHGDPGNYFKHFI